MSMVWWEVGEQIKGEFDERNSFPVLTRKAWPEVAGAVFEDFDTATSVMSYHDYCLLCFPSRERKSITIQSLLKGGPREKRRIA